MDFDYLCLCFFINKIKKNTSSPSLNESMTDKFLVKFVMFHAILMHSRKKMTWINASGNFIYWILLILIFIKMINESIFFLTRFLKSTTLSFFFLLLFIKNSSKTIQNLTNVYTIKSYYLNTINHFGHFKNTFILNISYT